ncbi:MAG: CoA-binding protein [Microbacterium sp.]|uniref:acetate--CoA ligase family protein n=1 Tax=Microbacterium sp. TaxID=51671 RepID=UPI00261E8FB4|nr:CoA-binding protein [Microbacterium sp.]MCX6502941.1 CoA-binding protein [Microbacterium sp.]
MQHSTATVVAPDRPLSMEMLLNPRSIAFIGASSNPEALGGRPIGFLASYGYAGTLYPVNPERDEVQGLKSYASILDVPEVVDIALIAVRAALVPGVLSDCARAGVGIAIVMSSGFGEGQGRGAELLNRVAVGLAGSSMRIIGPNCEGLASLPASAPMTFSPVLDIHRSGSRLTDGGIAIVSQSGGLGFAIAGWGTDVGLGYDYIVTTGNEIDVDALEIADLLVEDERTTTVVLVIEAVRDSEEFRRLGVRLAAAGKHLVVAKLGRSEAGARGALAHTQHVTGDHDAYRELFASVGAVSVSDNDELVDVLQALSKAKPVAGRRVGIVTTSGGAGVWLSDALSEAGFDVPPLSESTCAVLAGHMPSYGSPVNPVDLTAQFLAGGSFVTPLRALIDSGEVDLVVLTTSLSSSGRLAAEKDALAALVAESPVPIAIYSYTKPAPSCVDILNAMNVPWYTNSHRTARGLAALIPGGRS